MCHRSVTGVTCDTTRCGSGQCPPFRAKPMEAKKKATGKEYTCRKEIPYLEQKLEKREGSKKKFKEFNKNFTSSVQGKKKNIGMYISRAGDSEFIVYSNTHPKS